MKIEQFSPLSSIVIDCHEQPESQSHSLDMDVVVTVCACAVVLAELSILFLAILEKCSLALLDVDDSDVEDSVSALDDLRRL